MCVSYIGDSEMKEEEKIVEIPHLEDVLKLRSKIQEMEKEITDMTTRQV
jgi:TolA-binding protein